MFWGLIIPPNTECTLEEKKPFHISQAAMDISSGDNDPCQVMVVMGDLKFLVCTLQKAKSIQVPLDLYLMPGDSYYFTTNGKCNVHLTGYYLTFEEEEPSDDEEEEEEDEEEVPAQLPAKNKRKLDTRNDASATKKAKKEKPDGKQQVKAEKKKPETKTEGSPEKKEKKALSGGVLIEDSKVGSGPPAKPGKFVTVVMSLVVNIFEELFSKTRQWIN